MAGQSYNPSAKDHQEVISKVVDEEMKEVKETQKRLRTLKPYLFKETEPAATIKEGLINQEPKKQATGDSSSDEADSDDDKPEIKNKPVSRLNKLTRAERNLKLLKKMRRDGQEDIRKQKLWNKDLH